MPDLTLESLDDVPEPLHDLFEQDGEAFRLKPFETADEVEGLKSALETERGARKRLDKQLKEVRGKIPDDFDPEEWETLRQEREKRQLEEAERKGEYDKMLAQVQEKFQKKEKTWQEEREGLRGQLHHALVKTEALSALEKEDAFVRIMLPHVLDRMEMREIDGQYRAVVVDEEGSPRVNADGGYMTASALVAEMKESEEYEVGFKAGGATGGGARPGSAGGGAPPKKNRSQMSKSEKVQFIGEHGQDAFLALPE